MLFMGEEFGAETPFLFFCDFEKDLAAAVTEGRRSEFAQFARFSDAAERESIPDPNAPSTFEASRLNWSALDQSRHQDWLSFYRRLLILRKKHITSRLSGACRIIADYKIHGDQGLTVTWSFPDQAALTLIANLGPTPLRDIGSAPGAILYASEGVDRDALKLGNLPAWSVVWSLAS